MKRSDDERELRDLPFVESYSLDEFMLSLVIGGERTDVLLPEDYPRGEPVILGSEDSIVLRCGNLASIARQVYSSRGSMEKHVSSEIFMQNPRLENDIASFRKNYGDSSVEVKGLDTSEWIFLHIPIGGIVHDAIAQGWGLALNCPVTILLKFTTKAYTEQRTPPTVEMFQKEQKFPVGQQMSRAIAQYLACHWKEKWCSSGARERKAPKRVRSDLPREKTFIFDSLMEMGYESDFCYSAAENCDNIADAIDYQPIAPQKPHINAEDLEQYDGAKDPNKIVNFSEERGFLLHVADVLRKRIPTCPQYCVICDMPHLFGSMPRPTVCSRDVCVFGFQELSVGNDAAESVCTDPGAVDLLLNCFRLAVFSSRAETILTPFPHVPDPSNKSRMLFDPAKPNYELLRSVVKDFPSTEELMRSNDVVIFQKRIERAGPLVKPVLDWVLNSNRSVLFRLPPAQQLRSMNTAHQFVLLTAAPEKEKRFNELKKKHGTKFAFHGSGAENWHSILRNGLKNASGTKLMVNGAACGNGIYFAVEAGTSIGYCRPSEVPRDAIHGHASTEFISETSMICVALCEIVDKDIHDHGWCWTVTDEECVMSRFFFVYCEEGAQSSANTKDKGFQREIDAALEFYRLK